MSNINIFPKGGPLLALPAEKRKARNAFSFLWPENCLAGVYGHAKNQSAIQFYLACSMFAVGPMQHFCVISCTIYFIYVYTQVAQMALNVYRANNELSYIIIQDAWALIVDQKEYFGMCPKLTVFPMGDHYAIFQLRSGRPKMFFLLMT